RIGVGVEHEVTSWPWRLYCWPSHLPPQSWLPHPNPGVRHLPTLLPAWPSVLTLPGDVLREVDVFAISGAIVDTHAATQRPISLQQPGSDREDGLAPEVLRVVGVNEG